jgi:acyl phosphate:glycerol-3-phosphate acyltransferase
VVVLSSQSGLATVLLLLTSFLCGSIPFGLFIARAYGMDIRAAGSGNIGATNVWRVLGWKPGVLVLVLDALKGLLPVLLALGLSRSVAMSTYVPMLTGLAAVLGHTFTPWLRFKGGKGVATGLGVAIALYQVWILIPLGVFLLGFFATRMVSVGSILAAVTLALLSLLPVARHLWPFGVLAALLVVWTHRSNIKRILNGTEYRTPLGRKKV